MVFWWAGRWLRLQPAQARRYSEAEWSQAVRIGALLLSASVAGALANGMRGVGRGPAAALGYAAVGAMAALMATLAAVGWFWSVGGWRETAT